jgi:hypothetical protein
LAGLLAVVDYVTVGDEEVVAGEVFVCEFLFEVSFCEFLFVVFVCEFLFEVFEL